MTPVLGHSAIPPDTRGHLVSSLSAGVPCHTLAWLLHPAVEDARAPALLQLQPPPRGRCPGLPAGLQPQVQAHLLLRGAGLQGLQVGHFQEVYYKLH